MGMCRLWCSLGINMCGLFESGVPFVQSCHADNLLIALFNTSIVLPLFPIKSL